MLDIHAQVENGRGEFIKWVGEDDVREIIARCSDSDPYVDAFGEDVANSSRSEVDRGGDEFFTKE